MRRRGGGRGEKGDQVSESCNHLIVSLHHEWSLSQVERYQYAVLGRMVDVVVSWTCLSPLRGV